MTTLLLLPLLLAGPSTAPLPGTSLYQLDAAWTDQHGRATKLADLRGRVVLVAMVFTNCRYACPRMVERMKRVEAALSPTERRRMRFLLVSLDPARDTVPVLAAFAKNSQINLGWWTLLRGAPDAVRELSAALGVRYKQVDSGDLAHANLLTMLDAGGSVAHQQEGLESDVNPMLIAVRAELARTGDTKPK